ncbi:hypothetical protein [Cellulomonas xiejunii]|uniref:Uncharacterized protein n=1 Tax=Cellulomonas xiejunii TaxID=2968083 RepID=A0ABY5KPB8_9CELL|nr:hypothetical protein [Cellulomonas xiejunii]MCC2313651.1 hypothetical protein [Cellulomonas xiejunii]MCC2321137.1 hypothetical protein [Cellulomonas xiejunii]UUI71728.1 hypothetical protein NP048_18380 [Cellulomonas xiejunii]
MPDASRRRPPAPSSLTWADVAPDRHPFDAGAAPAVVRRLPPAAAVPRSARGGRGLGGKQSTGDDWVDRMSLALVAHYGPWASGWSWGRGESVHDGGPVAAWCCPQHSITSRSATLTTVATALVEWRSWLEELDERFGRFLPAAPDAGPGEVLAVWERAVADLVTAVVERTNAESGWYRHCRQVLGWFLSAAGVPEREHRALLDEALDGRFHSWSEPAPGVVEGVAGRLATTMARRAGG